MDRKEHIHANTDTRTQRQREATQDDRAAIPPIPTSTLSCPTLSLSHSLSLDPAFTHLRSSSSYLRTGETQKQKGQCADTPPYLSFPQPVLSGLVIFSPPPPPFSVRKRSTCESEHCCWDDRIQVGLWFHLFSLFSSLIKTTLIYFSIHSTVLSEQ